MYHTYIMHYVITGGENPEGGGERFVCFEKKVFLLFLAGMSESYYESGPQSVSQIVISLCTGQTKAPLM